MFLVVAVFWYGLSGPLVPMKEGANSALLEVRQTYQKQTAALELV